MTRVVSVGRSKSLFLAGALGTALLTVVAAGCPGTLDPTLFPPPMSGTAGTVGMGAAGTTGAAGTGAAGTGAITPCDAMPIFVKYSCTLVGSCHDAMGSAAKLDMATAGWEKTLVGKVPPGGGAMATPSLCATGATATVPYIKAGSNPATGLFVDKLTKTPPPCGAVMPNIGGPLTAMEKTCVIQWATVLANP
jgi:hypothetical protein